MKNKKSTYKPINIRKDKSARYLALTLVLVMILSTVLPFLA